MVKPNDEHEQLQSMDFQSQQTIAVFIQTTEYGNVSKELHIPPYNTIQGLEDVPQANNDCTNLREFLWNYNIVSEENIYRLDGSDKEQMIMMFGEIKERLQAGMKVTPRENYTLIVTIAGNNIVIKGENWYVLNSFDEKTAYYEKITIELLLRDIAKEFPNTYVIGLFSCQNHTLHSSDMQGFQNTSGSKEVQETTDQRPIPYLQEQRKVKTSIEEQVEKELSGIRPDTKFEQVKAATGQERFNPVMAVEENFVLIHGGLHQNLSNKKKKPHFILTLIETMKNKIDPRKLIIQIPQVFKSMQTLDASIDLTTSKTYQTLNLSMCSQVIINSLAVIFVTSKKHSEGWEEQGAKAVSLFKNVLRFKKVEVCRDYTKRQIIDKLIEVKKFAHHHEEMNKGDEGDLVIAINWCGPSYSIANKNFKIPSQKQKQNKNQKSFQVYENAKFEFQLYLARPLNGKDGSKLCQHYELTCNREPICINEYACQISEGPSTLVMQFNEFCEPERSQWMIESIIKTKNKISYLERVFHSKVLKSRPGRKQFSFFPSVKMDELYDCFFKQSKVQNMYIVPYLLDKSTKYESIRRHNWVDRQNKIIEPLQATLDSRTEEQKHIDATPEQKFTFATKIDIWQEAPQLIQSKVASKYWRASLHYLHKLKLILYATVIETNEINFTFLMNRPPYSVIQNLKHPKKGYVSAMYPIDRRSQERQNLDQNMFIAILIGHDGHLQDKKLVKFVRDSKTEQWNVENEKEVNGGKHMISEIRNCSLLDNGEIMLVTSQVYIMFNMQFKQLRVTSFNKSALTWAPNPVVSCFVPEYSETHNNGFLVAFLEVEKEAMNVYQASKQNFNRKYAKLLRCQYNSIRDKLEAPKYETDSLLVENQYINQVLEFAPNRIILVLDMTILLILVNWKIVRSMEDPGQQGRRGLWMCPLPFFNTDSFPFIMSSGLESINLINVKTFTIETLISQAATSISAGWQGSKGQSAGFFKIEEKNCEFSFHFSTRSHASNGKLARWHAMTFRRDFKEWLEDYGCLPSTFYARHANDVQRRKTQMRKIGEKFRLMVRERMTTEGDESTKSVINKQTFSEALIEVSQLVEKPKKEEKKAIDLHQQFGSVFDQMKGKTTPQQITATLQTKVPSRPDSAAPGTRLKQSQEKYVAPKIKTKANITEADRTPKRCTLEGAQTLSDEIITELRAHLSENSEMQTKLNNLVSIMEQSKRRKDEQEEELKVVHDTQEGLMYQYHEQEARNAKLQKMQQQQKDVLKHKEVEVSHLVAEKAELGYALDEMTKQYEDLKPVQKLADVLTELNRNLEEQLEEKQKIASDVNQKEKEAKQALMQREIMAQALTKKEIERAKTSSTREELASKLIDTQKDLDVARKEKYEQNRRIRELECINQQKEQQLQIQTQTIMLQKQLLAEQKKQNIAVKLFNPLAPYTAWNEFMPHSPSKTMTKSLETEQLVEDEKKQSQPRLTPFQSRYQTMMGSPTNKLISPSTDAITVLKTLPGAKLVSSAHTRQRLTIGRQNKSAQLLEKFSKTQDNWRKMRRPTSQSVTYEEKEKEAYEIKKSQPLPKPQSIAEILKFSHVELNSLEDPYEEGQCTGESYRQQTVNINQDSGRTSVFQSRRVSTETQIKRQTIRSKYNSITVASNTRKSNMKKKLAQTIQQPSMTGLSMSPMVGGNDTIYMIEKQKEDK